MLHHNALVLFESSDAPAVLGDPANADWLAVVHAIDGAIYDVIARRYYSALYHFRRRRKRPSLPGRVEVAAEGKQAAFHGVLAKMDKRKRMDKAPIGRQDGAVLVDVRPDADDETLHESLRDFTKSPPTERFLLGGPGRPPCDALCLMRAFIGASVLAGGDSPTEVFRLLRSNPTFARACGFLGRDALKQPGELTSRRLPSPSTCEEFTEVMTRYGLWQLARVEQVRENIADGVVETEDTVAFDTTHLEANSHCGNVAPANAQPTNGKKPKHRKVPRLRKSCECGKAQWEHCAHPWHSTDQGAAVVVKGFTRVYWAHKVSVASLGNSGTPIDVRALHYAAEHDGKTLEPHLTVLESTFPDLVAGLRHVLADDAYQGNHVGVARFGQAARLCLPVHPTGKSKAHVAARHDGVARFTPSGVPVCEAGHRFNLMGRDIRAERYIWTAPDDESGAPICASCPLSTNCLSKGTRRHIRVDRTDFPQIDWEHPQHGIRDRARYAKRTGVERAIKRLKVDLNAEQLTHRDGPRVQAHMERKLLALHLLLKRLAS